MPRKIRELISDLESAGFVNRGEKGSHRKFVYQKTKTIVIVSGNNGDDAKIYQEKKVREAIEEATK